MVVMIDGGKTCIYFDEGVYDGYCVYINGRGHWQYAPTDDVYFEWIKGLAHRYGTQQVWGDFCCVYEIAGNEVCQKEILNLVSNIDMHYNEDTILWWIVFYMTMIAENNKKGARLKKRIKRLGVYNILFDEYDINYVTTYMQKPEGATDWWKYLDKLMKERGI